jgi:F0F1-type ATP synthase assembly protein I
MSNPYAFAGWHPFEKLSNLDGILDLWLAECASVFFKLFTHFRDLCV